MLPIRMRRNSQVGTPLDLLRDDLDRVFQQFWPETTGTVTAGYPVDIREDDDHVFVEAELPGFTRDQVSVNVENDALTIEAERQAEEPKGTSHLNERRYTKVRRSFTLPTGIDANKVDAKLTDGVLHLKLPKAESVKPKRIEVK